MERLQSMSVSGGIAAVRRNLEIVRTRAMYPTEHGRKRDDSRILNCNTKRRRQARRSRPSVVQGRFPPFW